MFLISTYATFHKALPAWTFCLVEYSIAAKWRGASARAWGKSWRLGLPNRETAPDPDPALCFNNNGPRSSDSQLPIVYRMTIFILSRAAAPPFCQNLHIHFQLVYMYSCPHYCLTSTTPIIQLDGCRRWGKSTPSTRTNGWALSVKRAFPINRLFKSRLHALGAYRSRSGRFENLDQWEVGIN